MRDPRPFGVALLFLLGVTGHAEPGGGRRRAEIIPLRHQDAGEVAGLLDRLRPIPDGQPVQVAQAGNRTPAARSEILRPGKSVHLRDAVVVLGGSLASKVFNGVDPVGQNISLDGQSFQVIGVLYNGWSILLLTCVGYIPGFFVYAAARKEQGLKLGKGEIAGMGAVAALGVISLILVATDIIVI